MTGLHLPRLRLPSGPEKLEPGFKAKKGVWLQMRLAKPRGIKRFSSFSLPSLGKELPPRDSNFFWRLREKPEPAVFTVDGLFEYTLYRIK